MQHRATVERFYARSMFDPDTCEYFGGRRWFNYGLWDAAGTPAAACDALFAAVVHAVPFTPSTIVDVGCGLGEACALLTQRWPMARVIGVNISEQQLVAARARAPRAEFVLADATELSFLADGAVDLVLSIEAAFHFLPRTAFFREAHRVLRPGGCLSMADMLLGRLTQEPWISLWPPANVVAGAEAYAVQLRAAGFADVAVTDVTGRAIVPTVQYRTDRVARLLEAKEIGLADAAERRRRINSIPRIFTHYVLASARRPECCTQGGARS